MQGRRLRGFEIRGYPYVSSAFHEEVQRARREVWNDRDRSSFRQAQCSLPEQVSGRLHLYGDVHYLDYVIDRW